MDPVSQGTLGGAVAASSASRERAVGAAVLGALSGMAPDLDVLIRSSHDPLLFLEYHRQFTHALAFIPVGALICALLAHGLVRRWLSFRESFAFCLLGYGSHGLLDACTSYGTQLLWPFSEARIAWNVVAVIDPLFTLPLLVLLLLSVVRRRPGLARVALAWAAVYLTLGLVQGWRAERAGESLAEARGHAPERLLAKPSFGNLLVWKIVYAHDGWYYVDAVRLGTAVGYFPGDRVRRLGARDSLSWLGPGSRQARDLERFRQFSNDYLALAPGSSYRIIDVRYSLVPNEVDALWGIRLDPRNPGHHAEYYTDREAGAAERRALEEMLWGPGLGLQAAASERSRPSRMLH